VDGGQHETYVAERNLEDDGSGKPISHPLVEQFFSGIEDGSYRSRNPHN
jgi:heat shock protein HspQ